MSSWDQANRGEKLGLVWRNRKKISQIINDYLYWPFVLIILSPSYSDFLSHPQDPRPSFLPLLSVTLPLIHPANILSPFSLSPSLLSLSSSSSWFFHSFHTLALFTFWPIPPSLSASLSYTLTTFSPFSHLPYFFNPCASFRFLPCHLAVSHTFSSLLRNITNLPFHLPTISLLTFSPSRTFYLSTVSSPPPLFEI